MSAIQQSLLRWLREHAAARDVAFLVQNLVQALRLPHSRRLDASDASKYFLSALVRVKDEARFLPEWIAYHASIGIDHFYVYDNGSTDGTRDVIGPFISRGMVTLVDWPAIPISPGAERDFIRHRAHETEWVAFLDADEYIVEAAPGDLIALLRGAATWPAVALNWRYFGSSGHEQVPEGLILTAFTQANSQINRHVKVVAKTQAIHRTRNSHNFYYRRGRLARTPDGRRVLASFSDAARGAGLRVGINHYVYRSRADALRKVRRGFVDAQGLRDAARREEQVESDFACNNEITLHPDGARVREVEHLLGELGYRAPYVKEAE